MFVFGTFDEVNPPGHAMKLEVLAESVSTVPIDMAFEHWVANVDPAEFLMYRHLAWDSVAKRCVSVLGTLEAGA